MSDKNLSNKVAVVTGGADGIGEGIARTLRGRGAHVVIADVQEEKGALLAAELGENASFILLDVTDWESWNNLVSELSSHPGHLDILVNNAGGGGFGNLDQLNFEEWRNIMALNMDSVFLGCKAAAPLLKADGGARSSTFPQPTPIVHGPCSRLLRCQGRNDNVQQVCRSAFFGNEREC